jgi:hypothetical protein
MAVITDLPREVLNDIATRVNHGSLGFGNQLQDFISVSREWCSVGPGCVTALTISGEAAVTRTAQVQ